MNAVAIGLSALATGQRALDVIGHNIANAATPNYHRQRLELVDRVFDGVNGTGVEIRRVLRIEDRPLHDAVLSANNAKTLAESLLNIEGQTETALTSAQLDQAAGRFFDDFARLSNRPNDMALRRTVLSDASFLANALNQVANDIFQLRTNVSRSISDTVDDINQHATEIASLNAQIGLIEAGGQDANDLRDRRDGLIVELSGLIDTRVIRQDNEQITILAGGVTLVIGNTPLPLTLTTDPTGNKVLFGTSPPQQLNPTAGKLAGLLREHNQELPDLLAKLDDLAIGLMRTLDGVQATGLGLNGPLTSLIGQRAVSDVSLPLDQANLAIPAQAGELYISVTDLGSGQRELLSIAIDPAAQSLQDIAAAITAATAGRVQSTVNPTTGTLELQASAGFAFDFAGRLPSVPDNVAMNGTSVPQVSGTFDGIANDIYSFQIVGNGTVGVTPGLTLEVRDATNTLIATMNVGQGYTPDSPLQVGNGISVRLSAGTTNAGSFSARMIANPDTAGLLPAMGLNTLFSGTNAATMRLNSLVANDPTLLAASRSGDVGDGRNLERFAALREQLIMGGGTQTYANFIHEMIGSVGDSVRSLNLSVEATTALHSGLVQQETGVVGVDVNEEMVRLLDFQRLIESGARYLSVVNQSLDEIVNIVK